MSKTIKHILSAFILVVGLVPIINFNRSGSVAKASSFDQNNLIDNTTFLSIDSMSVSSIQSFLTTKGSFLKDFSEDGR